MQLAGEWAQASFEWVLGGDWISGYYRYKCRANVGV